MVRDGHKLLTVELPEEVHAEWKHFADEKNKYQNLSHLVRRSVNAEMRRVREEEKSTEVQQTPSAEATEVDISPIEDAIYDLESRIADMEDTILDEVHQMDLATGVEIEEEEMKHLMHKVSKFLPLVEGEEEIRNLKTEAKLPPEEMARVAGTVEHITAAVNYRASEKDDDDKHDPWSEYDVEQALAKLESSRGPIHSILDEGVRRYYKVDQ